MSENGKECENNLYKMCNQCRKTKEITEFGLKTGGKNGRSGICKACNCANSAGSYRKKHPEYKDEYSRRQDSIIRMIAKMDKEYEKADNDRFFAYVEKKYGYKYCRHCNALHPFSDFNVVKTQPPNQCIECFRRNKNNISKKILKTKEGLKKSYMRRWFLDRGMSVSCVPDDIKNVVLKMVELNMAIKHTGGI